MITFSTEIDDGNLTVGDWWSEMNNKLHATFAGLNVKDILRYALFNTNIKTLN